MQIQTVNNNIANNSSFKGKVYIPKTSYQNAYVVEALNKSKKEFQNIAKKHKIDIKFYDATEDMPLTHTIADCEIFANKIAMSIKKEEPQSSFADKIKKLLKHKQQQAPKTHEPNTLFINETLFIFIFCKHFFIKCIC